MGHLDQKSVTGPFFEWAVVTVVTVVTPEVEKFCRQVNALKVASFGLL